MTKASLASGTVHRPHEALRSVLLGSATLRERWNALTPLARNEWICWITSAKQRETQERRLRIAQENLTAGKKRPCCWPGCPHRNT